MLTVDDYGAIRRAARDGMSVREISRRLHRSRRKVREALRESEPRRYTRRRPPVAPKLDGFKARIDQILAEDEQAPRKQRHHATQIFRRLVAEDGYRGGYDQVRRYVAQRRRRQRETFLPLVTSPGQRAEADFGHIWVDFPEGRRQVPVLLVTWAWSYAVFAVACVSERVEAVLDGLVQAWEFSVAYRMNCGGTIRPRWPSNCCVGANESSTRGTPRWPAIIDLTRCSACRRGATRSRTWRIASSTWSGVGLRPCPRSRTSRN